MLVSVLITCSALLNDIICNSSVICVEMGIQFQNVFHITSDVSESQQKWISNFRGVQWIDHSFMEHCVVLV